MTESIFIVNNSEDNFRAAVFQKNYAAPTLGLVPWRIKAIPIGGRARIDIPAAYGVHVNFGDEQDPTGVPKHKRLKSAASRPASP